MRQLVSVLLCLCAATGVCAYSVSTSNANVKVKEGLGVDLTCSYSADFGSNPRLEWKFRDLKGSQTYVIYNGQPTDSYSSRITLVNGKDLRFSKVTRVDNGDYICEVSSAQSPYQAATVKLTVLVPPAAPMCNIPPTVTTNKMAVLHCYDPAGSPPPTYKWYKDGTLLPVDPSKIAGFQNATYKLDPLSGKLEFPSVTKMDSGQYYCEASNEAGPTQRCSGARMEVRDMNTGGIVAGVIIALLLLALIIFGVWFAKKKGLLPSIKSESKPNSKAVYQPTTTYARDDDDGEFKQKSSFVV
ncbi:F11 receptor, tandem duplicate 1 [Austrofundulus limnaeus]|uniref:Junctional adhesion molecule A n=1 Tax=Austrofundulus limnaeus TaxID=52670 RepID=A0A2I4B2Y9_AUSLI|nr:PREDICTED: junctional adhesion molecule A-like [Austrofundulus limnaeus]